MEKNRNYAHSCFRGYKFASNRQFASKLSEGPNAAPSQASLDDVMHGLNELYTARYSQKKGESSDDGKI